jgi:iron-sulfur cluster insertion protein
MDQSTATARIVGLTERAAKRIAALKKQEGNEALMLRISVSSGGCSGFSYHFDLDTTINEDDLQFAYHGETLLVDDASLDLLAGSELDYVENLVGSMFVMQNPNATATCGCGTSFAA